MIVFGTRPEAIKLAPVIKAFENDDDMLSQVVVTAQHKELLYQVLELFNINPMYDLDVMTPKQSLFNLSAILLEKMQVVLEKEKPDVVVVQGDTTTTFIASLSAFYKKIPVAHVEAGLRSFNKLHPFPEEINRSLTGRIADIHFAPTISSSNNLMNEYINKKNIHLVGNTIIDSLNYIINKIPKEDQETGKRYVLITAHRRENWGKPLVNLCEAIQDATKINENISFVFSIHKNPIARDPVINILKNNPRVEIIESQDYFSFLRLLNNCYFVLSDSGGIQEEAPALGKPVLVFRETTERPEGVEAGVVKIIGSEKKRITNEVIELYENEASYEKMSKVKDLYGDGKSSERILKIVKDYLSLSSLTPITASLYLAENGGSHDNNVIWG